MKSVSLKLPEDLEQRLTRAADRRNLSKSEAMRQAIEAWLAEEPATEVTMLDLIRPYIGCIEGPGDLATNPKYMEGFGD